MKKVLLFTVMGFCAVVCRAQSVPIDTFRSTVTIHVYKSGLFSGFAHNHTVQAPLASGLLDRQQRIAELTFRSADLKITDDISDSERQEIETTMRGPKVLNVPQFPTISFKSQSIVPHGEDGYQVTGDLKLHGASRSISFPVTVEHGRYLGTVKLKQTDYGIEPVKIAGGAVRVKDEIDVSFTIVPQQP